MQRGGMGMGRLWKQMSVKNKMKVNIVGDHKFLRNGYSQ